ncbi:protein phosphatase 2C domain-containing protein [Nocardia rosealba]|uniref:protein phosphatase 2C domain-containing protein n=1 Tax=Nocardia rosealba TaxID=2878563 RepID=UPI001CD9664B|nr:protein phosphatase 2C domain-containing protein [Nocardia rosealba]MCA2205739.1 protein phosphatase 2C domain-containing protein [Nocardia rosealba]
MGTTVESAQLAAGSDEDRLVVTDGAVIVLDGATAHDPAMPSAGAYVDFLAADLARTIGESSSLADILARSIARAVDVLGIEPGAAPSSTVALVRIEPDVVDVLVLGDSSVIVGLRTGAVDVHTDDRLPRLQLPEADLFRRFLADGQGYSGRHQKVLQELQVAERARRNRPDGYWIAEADPRAAEHALRVRYPRDQVEWIVAATDGAFDLVPTLGVSWPEVANMSTRQLEHLLRDVHIWEAEVDPDGQALPRAKRHDDKAVAVVRIADRTES